MTKKLGERWVHYIGKQSLIYRWAPWLLGLVAIMLIALGVLRIWASRTLGDLSMVLFVMAFLFFVMALLSFERRQFYLIIEDQKQKIAELEEQLLSQAEQ